MSHRDTWLKNRFVQELVVFVAMFALTMLHEWMAPASFLEFLKGLVFFICLYAQAQFNLYAVFPLLLRKKYAQYVLAFLASTLVGALLLFLLEYFWVSPEFYGESEISIPMGMLYDFVLCIISTIIILSLFLVRRYPLELQKRTEAQLLLSEMNLKFLHAQLNPHFFFNMLNNLYGVSLTDPERTPGLILRLSELMRYQLESGNRSTVRVAEELKFIDNYIAMERERIGKRCDIRCEFPPDDSPVYQVSIAPLILITPVENAFKHSVSIKRPWFIDIRIGYERGELRMDVRNSLPDEALKSTSTGIGLVNVKERLDALYPGKYSLVHIQDKEEYRSHLRLTLNAAGNE